MVNWTSPILWRWNGFDLTPRNIFPLKIFHSFKLIFKNIAAVQFCLAHSFRRNLLKIMTRLDPVGAIIQPSNSGSKENDRLEFIRCVGGWQPKIHEVWTFIEDRITPEVHPFAWVDVSAFVGDCFMTDYLTENGRRVTIFERKWINGSF